MLAGVLRFFGIFRHWRKSILFAPVLLFASSFAEGACGGGGGGGSTPVTTAGSYVVTVTATTPGVKSASTQIGLTIQ